MYSNFARQTLSNFVGIKYLEIASEGRFITSFSRGKAEAKSVEKENKQKKPPWHAPYFHYSVQTTEIFAVLNLPTKGFSLQY